MVAIRALLIGYGVAAIAGAAVGDHSGYLAGLLTAWAGGAILSLLVAYASFVAMAGDGVGDTAAISNGARSGGATRLVKVWDDDRVETSATTDRPRSRVRTARSVSMPT